jgi:hypothetical protein
VTLMQPQYRDAEPQATFVAALRAAGAAIRPPPVQPSPPFLAP